MLLSNKKVNCFYIVDSVIQFKHEVKIGFPFNTVDATILLLQAPKKVRMKICGRFYATINHLVGQYRIHMLSVIRIWTVWSNRIRNFLAIISGPT